MTFKKDARVKIFVEEYLIDFNGVRSAKKAGFEGDEKTLAVTASRLLRNAKVQRLLEKAIKGRISRTRIKADRVLLEIYRIGMSDLRKLFDNEGKMKHPKDWPNDVAKAVSALDVEYIYAPFTGQKLGQTNKIKLWNKLEALRLLVEHLGISKPREDDSSEEKQTKVEIYLPDNGRDNSKP